MESILSYLVAPETRAAAAFDDEGVLVVMNAALRALLGFGPDEDLSELILADLYPEVEYERLLWEGYVNALHHGGWHGRVTMRTKNFRSVETVHSVEARSTNGTFEGLTIRVRANGEPG